MDSSTPAPQPANTDATAIPKALEKPSNISERIAAAYQVAESPQQFKLFDPVESACRRHPGLTPEEALEMLEKFGY